MNYYDNPTHRDYYQPRPRPARLLGTLSVINLLAVTAFGGALHYWSEDWWLSTILVYLPKVPLAVPAGVLFLISLATRPRWALVNLLALILVLGPIMAFVAPIAKWTGSAPAVQGDDVRIVSCNIQAFAPDFSTVIAELSKHRPEIVAFQEVRGEDHPLLSKYFDGWHVARSDGYWVGSEHPVRLLRELAAPSFDRVSGIVVEVDLPSGTIVLADVHLMTARRSLAELSLRGLMSGQGPEIIEPHQAQREEEMMEVRAQIEDQRGGRPLIVLGDFNTPTTSSFFRRWWSDLQSAYDVAGFGWGYTSPCRKDHQYWFADTPWVRIDHILCSADWQVTHSAVGERDGSDHRLIAAILWLNGASQAGRGTRPVETADPDRSE